MNFGKKKKQEQELATVNLIDPTTYLFYENLENRVIWINENIGSDLLKYSEQIIRWNRQDQGIPIKDRQPIKIFIFSDGGDLYTCFHFIDMIKMSETPIYGYNIGKAMSAAFVIFISCDKRYCTQNSSALLHLGSSFISGNASDVFSFTDKYKGELNKVKQIVLEKTKISEFLYEKKIKSDWYLNAKDQIRYGVANKIITDISELL